jgi:BlaI family transcriptional regulator, penicillinase repressor
MATQQLSRREREIMDILYSLQKATTEEIRQGMEDPPTGNAVRTLLQILEEKGHLRRKRLGREYLYEPTQPRSRAGFQALQHVLATFYEGSIEKALTAHLARKREHLTKEEHDRIRQLIDKARNQEKEI